MNATVLIVEDEKKIAELISKYLVIEGFSCVRAENGEEALSLMAQLNPDVIILDVMLPGMDGVAVCEQVRRRSDVPIIMLTARVEEVDRLIGFAKGADDYVCKPFNPKELVARVHAILRRVRPPTQKNTLVHNDIELSVDEHTVKVSGTDVQLTQIEFTLLHTLMACPHQVFSREDLLTSVHGKYSESYERTIDFHIKNLRKKINAEAQTRYIKTIYGIGYKLL